MTGKNKFLIAKSNELVPTRYSLSLHATRIFEYSLSKIDPTIKWAKELSPDSEYLTYTRKKLDENGLKIQKTKNKIYLIDMNVLSTVKLFRISVADYAKFYDKKDAYYLIKDAVSELMTVPIRIDGENPIETRFFASAEYISKGDDYMSEIEFEYPLKLLPYIMQIADKFTLYNLEYKRDLKTTYAYRTYDLCKQWESVGNKSFEIEELRTIYNLEEGKYTRFADFKNKIIKKSVDEINKNKNSDITISFDVQYKSNRPISVTFTIVNRMPEKKVTELVNYYKEYHSAINDDKYSFEDLIHRLSKDMMIENIKMSPNSILRLYEVTCDKSGGRIRENEENVDWRDYIRLQVNFINRKREVRNKVAYLLESAQKDYANAFNQLKSGIFVNEEDKDVLVGTYSYLSK